MPPVRVLWNPFRRIAEGQDLACRMPADITVASAQQHSRSLWVPVTVRVAWELVVSRVNARADVLRDAREHVLRCIPAGTGVDEAEVLSAVYTRDFLRRAREGRYDRPDLDPDIGVAVGREWRGALSETLDREGELVLQLHYGDAMALEDVERLVGVDRAVLGAAREALREAFREVVGDTVAGWTDTRLDRLLARVAVASEGNCPGPVGLVSGAARAHADRCPRCARALRLLRGSVLDATALFAPQGALVGDDCGAVLALLLHPDGRRHRKKLEHVLGSVAVPVGTDGWLIPAEQASALAPAVAALCAESTPARHHLRGAVVRGPGRWSRGILLGSLGVEAIEAARARHWAEIEGFGELPAPLPVPPSASAWWAGAALAAAACLAVAAWITAPRSHIPQAAVVAAFSDLGGAWEVRFDTDDLAVVDVVAVDGGAVHRYQAGVRAGKGAWATGTGEYELVVPGDAVAIITSPGGVPGLDALMAAASHDARPLEKLEQAIRTAEPRADVASSERRPAS